MNYDAVTKQSLLYDFYGQLLTKRQREVMELYNEENLSLGEIAEEFGISRQGVHDALHKAQKALWGYRNKRRLVERWLTTTRAAINSIRRTKRSNRSGCCKASGPADTEKIRQAQAQSSSWRSEADRPPHIKEITNWHLRDYRTNCRESSRDSKARGSLTEADINAAMREVKLALLEADVNFKVVKEFVADVKEKALGEEVMKSLTPAQQVIKIVNDQLVELMGGASSKLTYSPKGFTVYMMVGLQGTGKTTTCGKLAKWLKKNGKKPMLCACDIYRPAAIDQLEIVGKGVDVPVFTMRGRKDPSQDRKGGHQGSRAQGLQRSDHRYGRTSADRRGAHGGAEGSEEGSRDRTRSCWSSTR